ncbi:MAG: helix-turn-helix transcriptional regulator [Pseudolabrys sp.]
MSLYENIVGLRSGPALAGERHDTAAFATCVRMARAALGWSQHDLARMLGMTQRSIHRIEQGHCEPRRVTVLAIENLLRDAGLSIEFDRDGGVAIAVPAAAMTTHADDGREH